MSKKNKYLSLKELYSKYVNCGGWRINKKYIKDPNNQNNKHIRDAFNDAISIFNLEHRNIRPEVLFDYIMNVISYEENIRKKYSKKNPMTPEEFEKYNQFIKYIKNNFLSNDKYGVSDDTKNFRENDNFKKLFNLLMFIDKERCKTHDISTDDILANNRVNVTTALDAFLDSKGDDKIFEKFTNDEEFKKLCNIYSNEIYNIMNLSEIDKHESFKPIPDKCKCICKNKDYNRNIDYDNLTDIIVKTINNELDKKHLILVENDIGLSIPETLDKAEFIDLSDLIFLYLNTQNSDINIEQPKCKEAKKIVDKEKQKQMNIISNLITDMTLKGVDLNKIINAIKYSIDIIDDNNNKYKSENNNFDIVNRPSHYCEGRKYEPAEVILDWNLDWCCGSAVKYISRAGRKDASKTSEDLRKAIWYLNKAAEVFDRKKYLKNKNEVKKNDTRNMS